MGNEQKFGELTERQKRELMKGNPPEMVELLDMLEFHQLGKPITRHFGTGEDETIGYMLPTNREQTKHLLIFKDGTVLVTEPDDPYEKELYIRHHQPSATPFEVNGPSLPVVVGNLKLRKLFYGKVTMDSTDPTQTEIVKGEVDKAIKIAQQLKEERTSAKGKVRQHTLTSFKTLLD